MMVTSNILRLHKPFLGATKLPTVSKVANVYGKSRTNCRSEPHQVANESYRKGASDGLSYEFQGHRTDRPGPDKRSKLGVLALRLIIAYTA